MSELPFAIVADGELVESRVSDIEVPWWSFGKTVIAAAALTLVQDGALVLDAPLPGAPYTLRQLLAHTSGLPDYGGVGAYHAAVAAGEAPWSEAELLQRAAGERLLFAPGTGWAYSNIGYLKVVRLIEATTHAPLDRALAALVFGPLGVTARQAITAADLAGVAFAPPGYDPGWVYHGLLVGRLEDAAACLDGLMAGRLLGDDLLAQMRTLAPLGFPTPGRPVVRAGYGLGLMGEADPSAPAVVGHTGGGPGSLIVVRSFPGSPRLAVAVAAPWESEAQGELEQIALDLAAACLDRLQARA